MPAAAVIPAVAAIGSGVMGSEAARGQTRSAERARKDALSALSNVYVPTVEEQQVALQNPELIGEYQAILEQNPDQLSTEMGGVSTDPRLAQAQMQYLEALGQQGQTGLTATDRNAFDQLQRGVASQEQSRQNAILQNMAQRGVGGSGMELAARLQSSQSGADRAQQESMALAAQAQQRALEAQAAAGGLAGQMRTQEFGEKSDIARAKDIMGQFNQQNQLATRRGNVQEQRQTQAGNLQMRQSMENQRTNTANEQEKLNKALLQQRFSNELGRAGGQAGQYNVMGNAAQQGAAATGQNIANIGGAVGSGLSAYFQNKDNELD